ncbi:MAG: hypothetical protein EOO92_04675 [Pedobacter sp.]|nr:MAG: hypothetical protein EOO92_04675 [Pedobacter sp.]
MAHMQDKDFDQLFKDQFEDAEITPSANLWEKIEEELQPKRKAVLPAYWMAAAVVIIAVSVGLLMPGTEKIKLQGATGDLANITATSGSVTASVMASQSSDTQTSTGATSTPLVIAPRLTDEDVKKDFAVMQPIVNNSHPDDMVVATNPVAGDAMAQLEEKVRDNEAMIASIATPHQSDAIEEAVQPEHKGIRNVGDLINLVVNKVDKREKKLIQFNTDEDDNSSLIAINIGFLKFNKRDK